MKYAYDAGLITMYHIYMQYRDPNRIVTLMKLKQQGVNVHIPNFYQHILYEEFKPSFKKPFCKLADIPLEKLEKAGIQLILLDAGGLLVRHGQNEIVPESAEAVKKMKEYFRVAILTNSKKEGRLEALEQALGVRSFVGNKPDPTSFSSILKEYDTAGYYAFTAGDRLRDIHGGNLAGLITAFVHPLANNGDSSQILEERVEEEREMLAR